jgi:hypothetical protein
MNTAVYTAIKSRILTVDGVKECRLFNNQFERSNNDTTQQNNEQAFLHPVVFIEFDNIEYGELASLVQEYTATVRIYIGFESYMLEDTDVFTLKQNIFVSLHGFQPDQASKLVRLNESTDTDHNNIYIYKQEYSLSGKDDSGATTKDAVTVTADLELVADLDIDNIVIRTGNGS